MATEIVVSIIGGCFLVLVALIGKVGSDNKKDNTYFSNWKTDYDSDVYIAGTIEPFTYNASETDEGNLSLFL